MQFFQVMPRGGEVGANKSNCTIVGSRDKAVIFLLK